MRERVLTSWGTVILERTIILESTIILERTLKCCGVSVDRASNGRLKNECGYGKIHNTKC